MTITAAQFRECYPEFANTVTYPNTMVTFWLAAAAVVLPLQTWGNGADPFVSAAPTTLYDLGTLNYVAHMITTEAMAVKAAAAGGNPGGATKGPVTSESVGGVSRSYDASAITLADGGDWNSTSYGRRFLWLARLVGKGPVQIGVDPYCVSSPWFGPPVGPNGYW